MSPKQVTATIRATIWVRSDKETKAGYYKDADGYRKRWEELVYYSKCGRFRKEYHVRADKEEYYFQLRASDGQDQEDMEEFRSFTELLENFEEGDTQTQLDL